MFISKQREQILLEFEEKYNLKFNNIALLNQAFVHTSYTNENDISPLYSYERLEFLGDAVLKLSISEIFYKHFEQYDEGDLTNIRAEVVSDKYICEFAKKLGFDKLLVLGLNEKKHGGANKESILACAFEAFLGAIFLDSKDDGYKTAKTFMLENFKDEILCINQKTVPFNPKANLQEYTQGINHTRPVYNVVKETGVSHDKTFYVEVSFENKLIGKGFAKTIKQAQQNAALDALYKLNIIKRDE